MERVALDRASPGQTDSDRLHGASARDEPSASPAGVLALQRAAGNRAVAELIGRRQPRMISRDPDAPFVNTLGGEYEYKIEHKGERASWSLRFSFSKAQTSPLTGKHDGGAAGPSGGDVKGQLLATKATRTRSAGGKVGNSMAMALGKLDLTVAQPWPGISVNADLKAFEAKYENRSVDLNVLKLGVMVQGKLSKDLAGTALGDLVMSSEFGKMIAEGTVIKVQGRFEVSIDPSDAARLARLVTNNGKIIRETQRGAKAKKALDALQSQQKALQAQLRNRRGKLSKAAARRLEKRIAANATKLKTVTGRLAKSKTAVEGYKAAAKLAAKGLKSKAGRLVGAAIVKAAGRRLLYLVPGLNALMLAVDIFTAASALYDLFTGKKKFGFGPDGSGDGSSKAEEGAQGGGGKGGADAGAGSGKDPAAAGKDPAASGQTHGSFELPPEINIDDTADAGEPEPLPDLHPGAKLMLEKLAADGGTRVSAEDMESLNLLVPKDITEAEATKLAERYKAAAKASPGDVFAGLSGVAGEVASGRKGTPSTTVTDKSGTEKLANPEHQATPSDEAGPDGKARKSTAGGDGAGGGGKGKGADAGGAGGTGKGSGGGSGGKKGTGTSKGAGLREDKAAKVVPGKLYYPGADVPKGESVSEFGFRVVSGYNPTATYRAGAQISLTIEFTRGGSTYRPTFSVKVVSHSKQSDKIVFEAVNASRWGITGTPYEMAEGAPLTLTSSVTAKSAGKKR